MPTSALSWKSLPSVTVTTMTGAGYIAGLKQVFDSVTYADGSQRMSGTKWTTSTQAVDGSLVLTAPNNPHGLIAHFVNNNFCANKPKSFSETRTNTGSGKVLGTIVLNPGTYASNTATPWGTTANGKAVRCFGYCHMSPVYIASQTPTSSDLSNGGLGENTEITSVKVQAWESVDAIVIHVTTFKGTTVGRTAIYVLGGWLAPDITAEGPEDAESDGVLYGVMTSGNCATWSYTRNEFIYYFSLDVSPWNYQACTFTGNIYNPPTGITTAQRLIYPHCGVFLPGTSNVIEVNRMGCYKPAGLERSANYLKSTKYTTISSKIPKYPMYFQSSDNFMGRAREMWMFGRSKHGLVLKSGGPSGQLKGHIISFNSVTAWDAFILSV